MGSLPEPYYTVRRISVGPNTTYEVCKWSHARNEPLGVYRCSIGAGKDWCLCPSYKVPCKHMSIAALTARHTDLELTGIAFNESCQQFLLPPIQPGEL